MTCHEAGCQNTELSCYKLALRNHYVLLCDPCFARLSAMGLALSPVERREVDLPVLSERRRARRPAWLAHLTGRADDSWRVA